MLSETERQDAKEKYKYLSDRINKKLPQKRCIFKQNGVFCLKNSVIVKNVFHTLDKSYG